MATLQSRLPHVFGILLVVLTLLSTSRFYRSESSSVREYAAPPKGLEHFALGNQNAMADLLWLRAIQDFDYCEQQVSENVCKSKSWLFQVLDVASDLSPPFFQLYNSGALALSVIISDEPGATQIFEKGLVQFPNDWKFLYKAAYHFLFELKDKKRAAELLEKAAKHGAPPWVYNTATRLYTEAGERKLAAQLYKELEHSNLNPKILERMKKRVTERARQISSDPAPSD